MSVRLNGEELVQVNFFSHSGLAVTLDGRVETGIRGKVREPGIVRYE